MTKRIVALVFALLTVTTLLLTASAENGIAFNESIFTDAGYTINEDVFSGQKVIYKENENVVNLIYSSGWSWNRGAIDTWIFGDNIKEQGELPAWTDGDSSKFHENQKTVSFYPCIAYNANFAVPYSYVVALSFPRVNNWLGVQAPFEIMLLTEKNLYTINRYSPSNTDFYHNILYITMDEISYQMFEDIAQSDNIVIRVISSNGKRAEFSLKPDCLKGIAEAWSLYVEAGGTAQDLTPYDNAISVRSR